MSLGTAFRFPFSNGNFNKVLQIGIVFGVISAIEVIINGGEQAGAGTFIGGIGGILFGLFLSGYGILVMQKVFRGDETLPEFEVSDSIGRGFKIFLASLVYAIPIIVVMACMFGFSIASMGSAMESIFDELSRQLADPNYVPRLSQAETESLGAMPLLFCGMMLLVIPVSIVLGYAAQIGMVRFAVEDRSGALFEFGTNIKLVLSNLGSIGGLFIRQLGIGILYFIIALILGFVVGFLGVIGTNIIGNFGTILFGSMLALVIGILNTAQQLSNIRLLAGFAYDADLVEQSKAKNDDMEDVFSF